MAVRVQFTRNYDYVVDKRVIVAYKAGAEHVVPNAHAEAAISAGAAMRLQREKKGE